MRISYFSFLRVAMLLMYNRSLSFQFARTLRYSPIINSGVKSSSKFSIFPSKNLRSLYLPYASSYNLSLVKLFSTPAEVNSKDSKDLSVTSLSARAKELWQNYGYVALGTYFGIYLCTIGSIFVGLDQDILNAAAVGLDPAHAVDKVNCSSIRLLANKYLYRCATSLRG